MYSRSLSIPEAVREIVAGSTLYTQSLQLGIANYTAIAQRIKPEVEKLVGSVVNTNSLVVTVKRLADSLMLEAGKSKKGPEKNRSFRGARMSLTSNVIDVDIQDLKQQNQAAHFSEMLEEFFEDSRYDIFQTDHHFRLFTEDIDQFKNTLETISKRLDGKIREGLSKITITLHPGEQDPQELLSVVSGVLYNHRVPVKNAFFTSEEMVLILDESDAAKAYELLRASIRK